jgi:hypothetical protein
MIITSHIIHQFCTITLLSFNMLFLAIGNNLAMNFEILAKRIRKTDFQGFNRKQVLELQEDFAKLNDLTRYFNDFYSFMMDIHFCVYIFMTGAYSIQLVKSDEISKKVQAAVHLLALYLLALFVYGVGENISREVKTIFFNRFPLLTILQYLECSDGRCHL